MAIVPDQSASNALEDDFGANDWLLEEMYEQYSADPGSVDPSWAAYFEAHGAPGEGDGEAGRPAGRPARPEPARLPAASAPKPRRAEPARPPPARHPPRPRPTPRRPPPPRSRTPAVRPPSSGRR